MTGFRVIIVAALLVPTFAAELPVIRLDTIFPPGGKAGAEVDAAVTGADLDDAKTIHFSHPGITGEAKEKRFLIKIAPDVPAGRILNLPISRLNTLRRAVFKEILRLSEN